MNRCWGYIAVCVCVFLTVWRCCLDTKLEQSLELAGDNRCELEKVLTHYQDSGLKFDAARFLIEHMPGCHGTDSVSLAKLKK